MLFCVFYQCKLNKSLYCLSDKTSYLSFWCALFIMFWTANELTMRKQSTVTDFLLYFSCELRRVCNMPALHMAHLYPKWLCSPCRRGNWRWACCPISSLCHALSLQSRLLLCLPHNGASITLWRGLWELEWDLMPSRLILSALWVCESAHLQIAGFSLRAWVTFMETLDLEIFVHTLHNISWHRTVHKLYGQSSNCQSKEHFSHIYRFTGESPVIVKDNVLYE